MKKIIINSAGLFLCFLLTNCVTTEKINNIPEPAEQNTIEKPLDNQEQIESNIEENKGLISVRVNNPEDPILLGTQENLVGPIAEFSTLYGLYFSIGGALSSNHGYARSEGISWTVESEISEETVLFERALLTDDDIGRSWWYFKVEGDDYTREYELLVENDFSLLELRYLQNGLVQSYIPFEDEKEIFKITDEVSADLSFFMVEKKNKYISKMNSF